MRSPISTALLVSALLFPFGATAGQTNVTMLVPGFTVRELPVQLSNLNNLRFAPDGKLTALAYDGRVHILRDTDGDGLEDTDTLFWDKATLSVPVGMAWSKKGLYVSSHGKVSLLRDTHGDGKADQEDVVASGWPATDVASGGVDATAVTLDKLGNLYFGLLVADYSNPYRFKDGVSHYDLNSKRGTIQKLWANSGKMETIANGIRVPYTLAFNRAGDLFVTDQEGATWCPGGNPLDELNQIIPGRNYGFPPRDEKYLPDLISEPPVVAFGPQHQSSCGFFFNEAGQGQRSFGPPWWEGDAFVAGESRGKIWRVRLVKTPSGYVGRETLIARLNMLTTDVALSPGGDLYVCCHSGLPDWGTGPQGRGKIFKISQTDLEAPQPVAAWASGIMEVRVAFDRPVDGSVTNRAGEMSIEFGEFVAAADRLEVLKPPYKVVGDQEATPRGRLRVISARLSGDARTLLLVTDPQPQSVRYAVKIPGIKAAGSIVSGDTVDLAYNLSGVEAEWIEDGATGPTWTGWLPHLDSKVNAAFTLGSAGHERLDSLLTRKGQLRLRTQLALNPGPTTLRLVASAPFDATLGGRRATSHPAASGSHVAEIRASIGALPEPLLVSMATVSSGAPDLHVACSTDRDPTIRPLPLDALLLPWAPLHQAPPTATERETEMAGGDYESGRSLFYGERLKCASCHRVRGQGAPVGPDLSNLTHRDGASVLRDIKEPSASINPDYVAYNVQLRDGEEITGFVRAQSGESLRIAGADGKERIISRQEVDGMRPSMVSLMPSGLLDGLSDGQIRDLLTFLLHEAPVRSQAEIESVLSRKAGPADGASLSAPPLDVVLIASKQDHGPGQHDYPEWQKKWSSLLGQAPGVTVSQAWEWPSAEQFTKAGVLVFYFWNHDWSEERYRQLDDYQARGGGLVVFHAATIADKEPEKLLKRIGLASQPGPTTYRHTPLVLDFVAPANHPITAGFTKLALLDEPYWPLFGDTNQVEVLATAMVDGQARPLLWVCQRGQGRVFASIPGHYTWTFDDPLFRILALRGIAWAAGAPASRLETLATGRAAFHDAR